MAQRSSRSSKVGRILVHKVAELRLYLSARIDQKVIRQQQVETMQHSYSDRRLGVDLTRYIESTQSIASTQSPVFMTCYILL
jgi:hypothetical protein